MNRKQTPETAPSRREDYQWFSAVQTRWSDNDVYGHVNNVTYYAYFDSVINRFLIEQGGLDIHEGQHIGFIVASNCAFFQPIAYPEQLECGFKVIKLGRSSVSYELGLFKLGGVQSVAIGRMTHVFVDRQSQKPRALEGQLLTALTSQLITGDS